MGFYEVLANDYNPYEHRQRPGQLGNIITLVHLIKGILGTGILALPRAFKEAGWFVGTILNIALHLIVCYCLHIMFKCMHYMCKKNNVPYVSYANSLGQAFQLGPKFLNRYSECAPTLVNFFIILYQFGTLCVYLIFCSSNIKMIFDDNTKPESHMNIWVYMTLALGPLLLLTYIKNLKILAPFSNVANWLTIASLLIVYYFVFAKMESLGDRDMAAGPISTALFIGTSMFAVLSIGVMLSVEQNMKDGSHWLGMFGVLNQAIIIVTILDTVTGLFGYWRYGDKTKPTITLNLGKNYAAWVVQALYSIAIMISYALQAYPLSEIVWDIYIKKYMSAETNELFWDYCMRTIVVLLSFVLAVPIPYLDKFISLFGALCLSMLGLILPALMDICIRWEDSAFGKGRFYLIRDIALMILGIFGGFIGSYSAIDGIVHEFLK